MMAAEEDESNSAKAQGEAKEAKADNVAADIFVLPYQVDITSVAQVFSELKAQYVNSNITFDAGAVDRITTPGVQLLISAAGTAKSRGGSISVVNPSEAFSNIMSDLGFSNQLKEWMDNNV